MSGEAERNYYRKQADSIKKSGDRVRSQEQSRASGDRLRKTEATDAMTRKIKEASHSEKEAFYKKQNESVEQSRARLSTPAEKKPSFEKEKQAHNEKQRKGLEASRKALDDYAKEHKLGDHAEKKTYRVPDPDWFKDK